MRSLLKIAAVSFLILTGFVTSALAATFDGQPIQCQFTDQAGLKLRLSLKGSAKGLSLLESPWTRDSKPVALKNLKIASRNLPFRAPYVARNGVSLGSKKLSISGMRAMRGGQEELVRGGTTSLIEFYLPDNDSELRANNPKTARAFTYTKASMFSSNNVASNLKGVCWK